jgi:hypothetical protein
MALTTSSLRVPGAVDPALVITGWRHGVRHLLAAVARQKLAVATLAAQFFSDWMFLRINLVYDSPRRGRLSVS